MVRDEWLLLADDDDDEKLFRCVVGKDFSEVWEERL
jgi:hypothetical protein